MRAERELIDVSHTVGHGRITYKGLPAPMICDYLSDRPREEWPRGPDHASPLRATPRRSYIDRIDTA